MVKSSLIEIYVNSALMWIKSSSVFIITGNLDMSGCDIEMRDKKKPRQKVGYRYNKFSICRCKSTMLKQQHFNCDNDYIYRQSRRVYFGVK